MFFRKTKPVCGAPSAITMLPVWNAVLLSTTTSAVPSRIWNSVPLPPQRAPPMSSNRLLRTAMRRVCPLPEAWLSSRPRMLIADAAERTTLPAKVTSSTTDQGAVPSWLRTVKRMAKPFCPWTQLCSNKLSWMRTRRAFFSSKRFLTVQGVPAYAGSPSLQESGFTKRLPLISMSEGIRLGDGGGVRRVHRDPATSALVRIAVQVAASEHEVMGDLRGGHPAVAQLDQVVDEGAFFRPQLDPHQPIMMRA